MSFADLEDRSSRPITAAIFILAALAIPLSFMAALEGLVTWGVWEGWALFIRLVCLASPIYVFVCIGVARAANRVGELKKAGAWLVMLTIPVGLECAWIGWAVAQS